MSELASSRNAIWRFVIVALCLCFNFTSGKSQSVSVDFTHDAVLCGSANVNFAATVSGPVSLSDCRFVWDFGDGKASTGQNVSNGFPVEPGATHLIYPSTTEVPFQVKLTVFSVSTNAQLATVTKPLIIRPAPIPELIDIKNPLTPFDNCSNNPTVQSPFFTVQVSNQSLNINTINSYAIDWGDGTGNEPHAKADFPITHIFNRLGLFKLKFTATGQNGCSAIKSYTVKNQGNPAIVMGSLGNTTGCAPVTFSFPIGGVKNNDPGTTYVWDFGDGTTMNWTTDSIYKNDSTVHHTYTRSSCDQVNGYYIVKITASNACKSTEVSVGGVSVGIKPEPAFNATNLCEGEAVQFINTTLPGMNFDCTKSVLFKWDFGDGSPTVITSGTTTIPHTFPSGNNEYIVKLSAINQCQDSAFAIKKITLTRRPVANATLTPLQGCKPLIVNATNSSTGDITTTLWRVSPNTGWSFGNGTNANSQNPQFIFNTKGNYVITLQVKNECTLNEKNFNVFVNGSLDVTFPAIANQCNAYTFDASMASVFKLNIIPNEVVQANWQITPATGFTFLNGTTAQTLYPQIRFDSAGDYTLKIGLKNGCDSLTLSKTFKFAFTPTAKTVASATDGCIPFNVHFDNASTGYQSVSTWSVTPASGAGFANGTTATSLNPDFQFTRAGNYTVKLSVTNSCGVNTSSFTIKAKDKPTVNLLALPDVCLNTNFSINSSNLNVSANNGGALVYDWTVTPNTGFTYQNGTFPNSANPSFLFTTQGTYQISVTVSNDCGSVTQTQTLNVRPPVQLITAISDTSGCAPKTIAFTDNSTGDQLTHKWTVLPATGFTYTLGNSTSASPSIQFIQPGIYTITHTLTGLCSTQNKSFTVVISTKPTVTLSSIADQCAVPFKLIIDSTNFSINQNNKSLSLIHWETLPETNVTYIDGTDENSKYPHFEFKDPGVYTVWVEAQNDCGLSTASQNFRILEHAAEQASPSATLGCAPLNVGFTDQSKGDLLMHSWSVSPSTGWVMNQPSTSASPDITFNKTGIYTVTHTISNLCGADTHSYTIKVKEPPTVALSPLTGSCNTFTFIADQQNMVVTPNMNDTVRYLWSVTPNNAVTYLNSTSDTSHYPVIQIADTGVFVIKVKATGECGFTESSQTVGITKGPQISLTPQLSNNCLPADLTFNGSVWGQNLVYNWTVTPMTGCYFC